MHDSLCIAIAIVANNSRQLMCMDLPALTKDPWFEKCVAHALLSKLTFLNLTELSFVDPVTVEMNLYEGLLWVVQLWIKDAIVSFLKLKRI